MKNYLFFMAVFFVLAGGCDDSSSNSNNATNNSTNNVTNNSTNNTTNNATNNVTNNATNNSTNNTTNNNTGSGALVGGCQIFPADNPWNTDISEYPLHENSDNFINSIGSESYLHPDFGTEWDGAPIGIPFMLVDATTPLSFVDFEYSSESDAGPYPIPESPLIEGGDLSTGDRHIIMLDTDTCTLYELYYAWPPGSSENSGETWYAGSGAIFDLSDNGLRPDGWTSADAAGLPILPGLIRYEETMVDGEINHAIRFTVSSSQAGYIHPATHFASSNTSTDVPPMGLRLRLKQDFDINGFNPTVQVILRALKKYGMIVADNGSNWYLSGEPDSRWNDEDLSELRNVPGNAFEVVYTGEILTTTAK